MNILFDINHPAHVHFFKNAIRILKSRGHHVVITARDKEVTVQLLRHLGFEFKTLSRMRIGLLGLAAELLTRQIRLFPILLRNKIQVCVSVTGACNVPVARLLGIPALVFYDTEHARLQNALTIPFATRYFTPYCYEAPDRKNQVRYKGVHELAYLHPQYFSPDPDILKRLGVGECEKFVVLRFVAWGASHDVGQKGMSLELKRALIRELAPHAKIFIVSESPLPEEFEPFRFALPPERVHDALYYAALFIGEGATMASECACLGTPAIYVNTLKLGYISMEARHGLVVDLEDDRAVLKRAGEIIKNADSVSRKEERKRFLADHIDVSQFIVDQILRFNKA